MTSLIRKIRIQQVRISWKRHLSCLCRTILILAPIFGENREKSYPRFSIKPEVTDRFWWFFNRKHGVKEFYIVFKFEVNLTKITNLRVPQTQNSKMAAMTLSNYDIQVLRKAGLSHVLETIFVKFYQNRSNPLGCRADTHTHTHKDIQTDRHTHTHIQPQSILINLFHNFEWLNMKMYLHFHWHTFFRQRSHLSCKMIGAYVCLVVNWCVWFFGVEL